MAKDKIPLADLFPWKWVLSPSSDSQQTKCPEPSDILSTMIAINAITACIAMVMYRRSFICILTCGIRHNAYIHLGAADHNAWRWRWIIPLALQLGANAAIAALFKYSRGYTSTFSIWELMIFYAARPRMEWVSFVTQNLVRSKRHSVREGRRLTGFLDESEFTNPRQTVGLAHLLSETGLQLLALGLMYNTVQYGRSSGFYDKGRNAVVPQHARTMYDAAACYLVLGSIALALQTVLIFSQRPWSEDEDEEVIAQEEEAAMKSPWRFFYAAQSMLTLLIVLGAWLASSGFWSGFVYLAQDRYCPPSLIAQFLIWTAFTLVGFVLAS